MRGKKDTQAMSKDRQSVEKAAPAGPCDFVKRDKLAKPCRSLRVWHRRDGYWEALFRFREELRRNSETEVESIDDQKPKEKFRRLDLTPRAQCGRIRQTSSCLLCKLRVTCRLRKV